MATGPAAALKPLIIPFKLAEMPLFSPTVRLSEVMPLFSPAAARHSVVIVTS